MTEPAAQAIPFKVFGLQRTGTNLMVALLTRNFVVRSLEIGAEWKHGPLIKRVRSVQCAHLCSFRMLFSMIFQLSSQSLNVFCVEVSVTRSLPNQAQMHHPEVHNPLATCDVP